MTDSGSASEEPSDVQQAIADIDEVLASGWDGGVRRILDATAARLKECIERRTPAASVYRRMADEVRIVEGKVSNRKESRLRGILTAFLHELAGASTGTPTAQYETTWFASLQPFPSDLVASQAALLKAVEAAVHFGREARVLVLVARETSTVPWKAVFGRIDLVRPGDPAPLVIHPQGNVQVIEERPAAEVLLARLTSAMGGGGFTVEDATVTDHGMDGFPWTLQRHSQNGLDYGTAWPCLVCAPLSQIKSRPHIDGAIETEGRVFMGLDPLAWALSGFRRTPVHGIDLRPRRFQVLLWDYRGRIEQFRSTGTKLFVSVWPPDDRALRLVAVAEGASTEESLAKDAPRKEQLVLGEQILRGRATLRHGDYVVVEHALDRYRDAAITRLQGFPPMSGEFGELPPESSTAPVQEADPAGSTPPMTPRTENLSILFMDLSGWSALRPPQIATYLEKALPKLADKIQCNFKARHLNTWGDALVAAFGSAREAAECALDIRDYFRRASEADGIPRGLTPRLSLHVGEVIVAWNPFIQRSDIFGDAVHLAARLEPKTEKGQVFCTQQLADALGAITGLGPAVHRWGEVDLPKNYGRIMAFVVTGANETPPTIPGEAPAVSPTPSGTVTVKATGLPAHPMDRANASEFRQIIDSRWMVNWRSGQESYTQYVRRDELNALQAYLAEAEKPERSFRDPHLKALHEAFLQTVGTYLDVSARERVPSRDKDVYVISTKKYGQEGWIDDYDQRYERQVKAIRSATGDVWSSWENYARESAVLLLDGKETGAARPM